MPTSEMLIGEHAVAKLERPPVFPQNPLFLTDVFAEIDKLVTDPTEQIFIDTLVQLMELYDQAVIELVPFVQENFFLPFIE